MGMLAPYGRRSIGPLRPVRQVVLHDLTWRGRHPDRTAVEPVVAGLAPARTARWGHAVGPGPDPDRWRWAEGRRPTANDRTANGSGQRRVGPLHAVLTPARTSRPGTLIDVASASCSTPASSSRWATDRTRIMPGASSAWKQVRGELVTGRGYWWSRASPRRSPADPEAAINLALEPRGPGRTNHLIACGLRSHSPSETPTAPMDLVDALLVANR